MSQTVRSLAIVSAVALVLVASASAGWAGGDPARNFPLGKLPLACRTARTGAECINAGVYYLDKARASAGLGPYALPADFPSLTPAEQMFILTNLDRTAYDLPPVPGLTAELNDDALVRGVQAMADPSPSDTEYVNEYTSNWAGGYPNVPIAYEAWMWDDGLGSDNIDCTASHKSGCWEHRHNLLWQFDPTSILAMGAATGLGPDHSRAYTTLLVAGDPPDPELGYPGYTPTYSYTWGQAVADGAGENAYDPGTPRTGFCRVPNVIGKPLSAAKRLVTKSHCAVGPIRHRHTALALGLVAGQRPAPGRKLPESAKVRLVVSLGPGR